MRKLKPSTTFENPSYSEVRSGMRERKFRFFMACLTFALPCRWKTKSLQEVVETPPPLGPPHSSHLLSLRRGIDRAPSHRPRTLSKTQPTSWRRTAMYNPSLTAGVRGGKKQTRFAQNLFFYAACVQISSRFKKEKYISIELRRKSLLWLCLLIFHMPILVLMFSLFWCTICISLHWSCW